MKIQCDVCDKDEASVFCIADEAALCAACDHRVHHANKVAGKHHRFSLHHPSPKEIPLCDICQEKKAFLFCQQDRAILCKDCDIQIHKANELTKKHTRFLLTGLQISSASTVYSSSSSSESASSSLIQNSKNKPAVSVNPPVCTSSAAKCTTTDAEDFSISEYLIEMLPGWHFEDFIDSSSSQTSLEFSKVCNLGENGELNELLPFWDGDVESNMGLWVPQNQTQNQESTINGLRDQQSKDFASKSSRKRKEDNSFAVPQINPTFKRSRIFW